MSVTKRDSQYHTYGDYLIWSRTHGDELIDGTAYVREPPSPTFFHQVIAGEILHQLLVVLDPDVWEAIIAPMDVRLPKSTEPDADIDTVVQPDVLIVGADHDVDKRGVRGAPAWLAEVLSPATARYDQNIKIPRYERAGVPEVWLINLTTKSVAIYRLSEGKYGLPTVTGLQGKTTLTSVPGAVIDWDRIVAKIRRRDPEF